MSAHDILERIDNALADDTPDITTVHDTMFQQFNLGDYSLLDGLLHECETLCDSLAQHQSHSKGSLLATEVEELKQLLLTHNAPNNAPQQILEPPPPSPRVSLVSRSVCTSPELNTEPLIPQSSPLPSPVPVLPTLTPPTSPPPPVPVPVQTTPVKVEPVQDPPPPPNIVSASTSPILLPKELPKPPPEIRARLIPVNTTFNVKLSCLSGLHSLVHYYPQLRSSPVSLIAGFGILGSDDVNDDVIKGIIDPLISPVMFGLNPSLTLNKKESVTMSPMLSNYLKNSQLITAISVSCLGDHVCCLRGSLDLSELFSPGGIATNSTLFLLKEPVNIVNLLQNECDFDYHDVFCTVLTEVFFDTEVRRKRQIIEKKSSPITLSLPSLNFENKSAEIKEIISDQSLVESCEKVEIGQDEEPKVTKSGGLFERYRDLDMLFFESENSFEHSNHEDDDQEPSDDGQELSDDGQELSDDGQELSDDGQELSDDGQESSDEPPLNSSFDQSTQVQSTNQSNLTSIDSLSPLSLPGSFDSDSVSDFVHLSSPLPPKPPSRRAQSNIESSKFGSVSDLSMSLNDPELALLYRQVQEFGDADLLDRAGINLSDLID
ncbi:hypothetical protein P9112_011310 [Eukaryota sp. TZLM1-RC]